MFFFDTSLKTLMVRITFRKSLLTVIFLGIVVIILYGIFVETDDPTTPISSRNNGLFRKVSYFKSKNVPGPDPEPMTQSPEAIRRLKKVEAQLLNNIHQMTQQKIKSGSIFEGIPHLQKENKYVMLVSSNKVNGHEILKTLPRLIHLDFKGAPPKIEYLRRLFPLLKDLGATTLLVEYEDMFPYNGTLELLKSTDAFTTEEIVTISKMATASGLEIIPLLPTFGNLEFVLKMKKFSHLREERNYPEIICPSNVETRFLLKSMIDQIIALHPNTYRLHIGSNKIGRNIGTECNLCRDRLKKQQLSSDILILDHIKYVASYVTNKYKIIPLIWDEPIRKIDKSLLQKYDIGNLVELVVVDYSSSVLTVVTPDIWDKYSRIFSLGVWIGSAYKCIDNSNLLCTPNDKILENQRSWMTVISSFYSRIKFLGVVLTGRQRIDHFSILCDLLPVSITSLALSLYLLNNSEVDIDGEKKLRQLLGCDNNILNEYPLNSDVIDSTMMTCDYPGSAIFTNIQKVLWIRRKAEQMRTSPNFRLWLNEYNIRHKFSNPRMVEQATEEIDILLLGLDDAKRHIEISMLELYPKSTVIEWSEQHLQPVKQNLHEVWKNKEKVLGANEQIWKKRPVK